ncbi:DUF2848 domain-containing protein [Reyranella massiliensis]|uniref:DUF2848 domain-containing protein n=1 Tax=Reyranella massiliensis TaxID=445220 RepID=UPI0002DBD925|nr:DUF2848 domain-containing protein [Reyranella massiliensis]
MARLEFDGYAKGAIEKVAVDIKDLVIAGWTGRDVTALNHHIEELKAIGVQPPSRVPIYYRASAQMLTQADRIQVLGDDSSGEVEPVLVGADNRLWVTVGADHTDRKVESYGIAVSKQMCAKPIGRTAWRFEEVEPHWDRLMLRSFIQEDGRKVLYQEGTLAKIRDPRELIFGWKDEKRLPMGAVMFCGTMPAIGAIRPSPRFEMELDDPVLGRKISHAYEIEALPVIS